VNRSKVLLLGVMAICSRTWTIVLIVDEDEEVMISKR
jgi:hypothetical protein